MLHTSIAIYDLRIRNNPFGRVMGRKTVLVIRVLSSIGENFAEELQKVVDRSKEDNECFNWDDSAVAVLYFGMAPYPVRGVVTLPDGTLVKVFNMNQASFAEEIRVFRPYTEFLERARTLLLEGMQPEDVLDQVMDDPKILDFLQETLRDPRRAYSEIIRLWLALKDDGVLQ